MFAQSYLQSAKTIIQSYKGDEPFSSFLKKYFAANKKFGSRDRKNVSHLCYCFFRLGKWNAIKAIEDRVKLGVFLCSTDEDAIAKALLPEWTDHLSNSINEKVIFLESTIGFKWQLVFPWVEELSSEIDQEQFSFSFFIQPKLYLRIRPYKKEVVLDKLSKAQLPFKLDNDSIELPISTRLNEVLEIDKEVVIQDISSQKTLNPLFDVIENVNTKLSAWDCCAASGGKSLLLVDRIKNVELTVSDIRESILVNLKKRFERAGIKRYNWFIADVSSQTYATRNKFDIIICDAPCSGSGTWSRTPEQLYSFQKAKLNHYTNLQKKISLNASRALKENGFFVYITCSVFKKENEEVVEFIQNNTTLKLLQMQYLKGYNIKGDTLFTALFTL